MLALLKAQKLHILNCHQHTETADFLGGFRPLSQREREEGSGAPFAWSDGPLVHAMKGGDLMLVDEINLAEDSVIERLNSVLEKPGVLVLAEKGGREVTPVLPRIRFYPLNPQTLPPPSSTLRRWFFCYLTVGLFRRRRSCGPKRASTYSLR